MPMRFSRRLVLLGLALSAAAVLVGVGLVFFLIWLSQPNREGRKTYDILFTQSVGGLAKGAQVTYSGVPVGQVDLREGAVLGRRVTQHDGSRVLRLARQG